MANNSGNKQANFINKLGFYAVDVWRKVFFLLMGGTSLVVNMLISPRVVLLYKDAGIPFQSLNYYISYIAIAVLFILAFVPMKKDPSSLSKSFITFIILGAVLFIVSLISIVSSVYTLTSVI